eukprot:symbB.v1.2.035823.t2/scaffold4870.1/size33650/2
MESSFFSQPPIAYFQTLQSSCAPSFISCERAPYEDSGNGTACSWGHFPAMNCKDFGSKYESISSKVCGWAGELGKDHDLRQAAHCAWQSQTPPFEVSTELPSSALIPTAQRQPRVDFVSSATAMKSIFRASFETESDLGVAVHRLGDWLVIDDGSELSWCPHHNGPDQDLWAERVRDAEQHHRACLAKVEAAKAKSRETQQYLEKVGRTWIEFSAIKITSWIFEVRSMLWDAEVASRQADDELREASASTVVKQRYPRIPEAMHGAWLVLPMILMGAQASIDAEGAELIEGDDPEDLEFDDDQSKDDIDPRHACKPPLTPECSFPCLCCDGPGPNDCVICSEGYACYDHDSDGAGTCMEGEPGSSFCGSAGEEEDMLDGEDASDMEDFSEEDGRVPEEDDSEEEFEFSEEDDQEREPKAAETREHLKTPADYDDLPDLDVGGGSRISSSFPGRPTADEPLQAVTTKKEQEVTTSSSNCQGELVLLDGPPASFHQVGVWNMADDASVVVGSRLLCLGNQEHPKLTLYLHDDRMISDTMLLEHWIECLMAGVPEFAVCFHRDGAVQSYSLYKLSELQRFLEERMELGRRVQMTLEVLRWIKRQCRLEGCSYWLSKDKQDSSLKLIKLSGNEYPQEERGAWPVCGTGAGLDESSSVRRALSCPARLLGNEDMEEDLSHLSPFSGRISTLFFRRAVSSVPGPDAARFFRQVLDLEAYSSQISAPGNSDDEEGPPVSVTAGRNLTLQACSHLGLALCELESSEDADGKNFGDLEDFPSFGSTSTSAQAAALLSRLRRDLPMPCRRQYRMLPWGITTSTPEAEREASHSSTARILGVPTLFTVLPPWPSSSSSPTDVSKLASAMAALNRSGDALDLLGAEAKHESPGSQDAKRLEALALPIAALVLLELASAMLRAGASSQRRQAWQAESDVTLRDRRPLWLCSAGVQRGFAAVGDRFPDVEVDMGYPPTKVNMVSRLAGKKTIVVGVPGAFTPTCSTQHVPGFLKQQDALKGKGIHEVLVCSVNDGAVMDAWARDQKIEGSMITFLADTEGNMARSLNLLLDTPKIRQRLGGPRLKRFAMLVKEGVITEMVVAEDDAIIWRALLAGRKFAMLDAASMPRPDPQPFFSQLPPKEEFLLRFEHLSGRALLLFANMDPGWAEQCDLDKDEKEELRWSLFEGDQDCARWRVRAAWHMERSVRLLPSHIVEARCQRGCSALLNE